MAQANIKAVITAEDRASAVISRFGKGIDNLGSGVATLGSNISAAGRNLSDFGSTLNRTVRPAAIALGGSIAAVSKMAFDQVRSVENATFALRAYEKDATKVNKVLGDLVKFARSDMGTLFQRQDLFDAATTLRIYGQSTESLTDKVKILARAVSIGKTTFQELSQIVGRAAAKGRLDAVDFDMLVERGIGLDKSFRGASVSSEKLFKELERVLPAQLLEGRANTIDGALVKLQSSFRDLGAQILGVDSETSKFVEGGGWGSVNEIPKH